MNSVLATLLLAGALTPAWAEQLIQSPIGIRSSDRPGAKVAATHGNPPAHQFSAMKVEQGERRPLGFLRSEKLLPELEWITPLRHWLV